MDVRRPIYTTLALATAAAAVAACTADEGDDFVDVCPGACLSMEGVYTMSGSCPPTYCTLLQDDCSLQLSCDDGTTATARIEAGRVEYASVRGTTCSATMSQDGFSGQCSGPDFQCFFQGARPLIRACIGAAEVPEEDPPAVDDCTQAELDAGLLGCDCRRATRFGRTYLFCPQSAQWAEAQAACRARGGDLVTIDDGDEQAYVAALSTRLGLSAPWVGANDQGFEDTFTWSDGSPWQGLPWAQGEPNNELDASGKGEDCVHLSQPLVFNDLECDAYQSFVCEGTGTLGR